MKLAPIILFVYNRPWHTRQTLEALAKNDLASYSTLHIYADGPKENASNQDLNNIKETRNLIKSKKWCNKVITVEHDTNKGLAQSVIEGISNVINIHGKVIVLEDDIIVSPVFLEYMNRALECYKNEERVKTISGYIEPNITQNNYYFLEKGTSWGWSIWKRSWNEIIWDVDKLISIVDSKKYIDKLNFSDYPYYQMLQDYRNGKNNSWAIRALASFIINDGLHLTPHISYATNIGFDNSGTHCSDDDFFHISPNLLAQDVLNFENLTLVANDQVPVEIKRSREEYYKNKKRILNRLKDSFKYRISILLKK